VSYDSWLVAPYEQREAAGEQYLAFCEARDLDPYDDASLDAYDDWLDDVEPDVEPDEDGGYGW
jgi:hypothetical protein